MTRHLPSTGREGAFAAALLDPALPPPAGLCAAAGHLPRRRFEVYRDNVVGGLVRALASRFPVVERLVGAEFFGAMARAFVFGHPPRSPLMIRYGEEFPAFIETFGPAARRLPYLADLARLEDARTRAFHAADAAPLAAAAFAALDPGRLAELRIRLHPSVRVVPSRHPVVTLWSMHRPGRSPGPIADWRGEDALVARPALEVEVHRLRPGTAAFFLALGRGSPLGDAAEAGAAASEEFDPAAALTALVALGLAASLHPGTAEIDR